MKESHQHSDGSAAQAGPSARGLVVRRGNFELTCNEWLTPPGLTVLVGLNGAGKSTLIQALSGSIRAEHGTVHVHPAAVVLPQNASVVLPVTVRSFLSYVAAVRGVPRAERPKAVSMAMHRCGLDEKAATSLKVLSGGWRQRAMVAQTIVGKHSCLLLDEPTSALDVGASRDLWHLLSALAQDVPTVVATHQASAAVEFADHLVVILDGRVLPAVPGTRVRDDHQHSGMSAEAYLLERLITEVDG